jgi:hypothetical protein
LAEDHHSRFSQFPLEVFPTLDRQVVERSVLRGVKPGFTKVIVEQSRLRWPQDLLCHLSQRVLKCCHHLLQTAFSTGLGWTRTDQDRLIAQ